MSPINKPGNIYKIHLEICYKQLLRGIASAEWLLRNWLRHPSPHHVQYLYAQKQARETGDGKENIIRKRSKASHASLFLSKQFTLMGIFKQNIAQDMIMRQKEATRERPVVGILTWHISGTTIYKEPSHWFRFSNMQGNIAHISFHELLATIQDGINNCARLMERTTTTKIRNRVRLNVSNRSMWKLTNAKILNEGIKIYAIVLMIVQVRGLVLVRWFRMS